MLTHSPLWAIPSVLRSPAGIRDANSPNRAELRTFSLTFCLQHRKERQRVKVKDKRACRNPIALARECQAILYSGECSSAADLARMLGVSRARVTQVMGMLHLAPEIREHTLAMPKMVGQPAITERALRPIAQLQSHV